VDVLLNVCYARALCCLVLKVCMRQEQPLSWVVSLIKNVCTAMDNSRDRVAFLYGIVDMFKEAVLDVHEFGDAGMTIFLTVILFLFSVCLRIK